MSTGNLGKAYGNFVGGCAVLVVSVAGELRHQQQMTKDRVAKQIIYKRMEMKLFQSNSTDF